jgi:hypothetical protein
MKDKPGMTVIYKKKYCLGTEKNNCARYHVRNAIGKEKVPPDLYPNQIERANKLIAQEGTKGTPAENTVNLSAD